VPYATGSRQNGVVGYSKHSNQLEAFKRDTIPGAAACLLNWNHISCKYLFKVAETIMTYFNQLKTNPTVADKITDIYNHRCGK
jgi:hypothetical protein